MSCLLKSPSTGTWIKSKSGSNLFVATHTLPSLTDDPRMQLQQLQPSTAAPPPQSNGNGRDRKSREKHGGGGDGGEAGAAASSRSGSDEEGGGGGGQPEVVTPAAIAKFLSTFRPSPLDADALVKHLARRRCVREA